MATIRFDNRTFTLDDDFALPEFPDDPVSVAAADERVRESLQRWHPGAANTSIARSKEGSEHVLAVTIRSGIKASREGSVTVRPGGGERLWRDPVLRALCRMQECPSPALSLLLDLKRRYPGGLHALHDLVRHYDHIQQAARESRTDVEETQNVLRCLREMPEEPGALIPWGF